MSNNGQPELHVFPTGAVRTRDADGERYDLISPIGLERLARIYAEGAKKYAPMLWEKGMSISDIMNHGLRHWRLYSSGDRSEDHLAKLAWAAFSAMHSEVMWPGMNLDLRRSVDGQLCIPPTVDDETAASWRKFKDAMAGLREECREAEGKVDEAPVRHEIFGTVEAPAPKVPTRFYFLADSSDRLRMAGYRSDLQWEGHEVVSRWIDFPGITIGENDFDLQSCDVAIVLAKCPDVVRDDIRYAHHFNKRVVAIGECPDGYPEHGTGDRWFSSWEAFLKGLSSSLAAGPVVASR